MKFFSLIIIAVTIFTQVGICQKIKTTELEKIQWSIYLKGDTIILVDTYEDYLFKMNQGLTSYKRVLFDKGYLHAVAIVTIDSAQRPVAYFNHRFRYKFISDKTQGSLQIQDIQFNKKMTCKILSYRSLTDDFEGSHEIKLLRPKGEGLSNNGESIFP